MPIYEYDCPKCGVIEVTQRITEAALSKCPTCKRKVTKLISATSFQLKGEGWYVTDYARKGKGGKGGGSDAGANGSSTESKPSESKSESKSDGGSTTKASSGGSTAKSDS